MPVYIWCDSLTYKPYLGFANSTKNYYPSYKGPTPPKIKAIMDKLGVHYYGQHYDQATGTVHKAANIVSDPSSIITEEDRNNPDIDFFARVNPGYMEGRGLLTIVPASLPNFLFCAQKCLKRLMFAR